jgi:hypothetical protein
MREVSLLKIKISPEDALRTRIVGQKVTHKKRRTVMRKFLVLSLVFFGAFAQAKDSLKARIYVDKGHPQEPYNFSIVDIPFSDVQPGKDSFVHYSIPVSEKCMVEVELVTDETPDGKSGMTIFTWLFPKWNGLSQETCGPRGGDSLYTQHLPGLMNGDFDGLRLDTHALRPGVVEGNNLDGLRIEVTFKRGQIL